MIQRLQLSSKLVSFGLARLAHSQKRRLNMTDAEVAEFAHFPDTPLVNAAIDECIESCTPAIAAHCHRTFIWGAILGGGQGLKFDREALAVSALLHDLELSQTDVRTITGCACFACASGLRAERFVLGHGRSADWAARIGDAICFHLDPVVPLSNGVEAHLLQAGAGLDVIGANRSHIPAHQRSMIYTKQPLLTFKSEMREAMQREARQFKNTRAGVLMSLGFGRLIEASPHDAALAGCAPELR